MVTNLSLARASGFHERLESGLNERLDSGLDEWLESGLDERLKRDIATTIPLSVLATEDSVEIVVEAPGRKCYRPVECYRSNPCPMTLYLGS